MTDSGRDKDWKRRYLDSLEEHERKEQAWEEKERDLRRSISRLSFLGDGLDPALDARLEQLRNQVRSEKDIARLQRVIDGITRFAEGLEAKSRQAVSQAPDLAGRLRQAIESVPFPPTLAHKAEQLTRELDRESLSARHLEALQALMSGLVAETTADTDQTDVSPTPGPFARLFGKSPTGGETETVAPGHTESLDSGRTPSKASETDTAVARDVLLRLLDKLEFPRSAGEDVEGLKARLREGVTGDQLAAVVDRLVDLLSRFRDMAEHERQDVEGFLRQLTDKLKELDSQLGGADAQGKAVLDHSRKLGSLVEDEMSGIRDSVESADDLSELKLDITRRLQRIQEQLERHRADDEHRSRDFERCISGLRERLGQVELEADRLRNKVEETRTEAFTDALTGINNRLAFDVRMKQEYARWQRYGAPLSLVMLDLDRFKQINDSFGHKAGDKVLQVMGKLLQSLVRDVDCPARYGGEEFVLLLPETDLKAAMTVAEKIRREVEKTGFHSRERKVEITLSAGAAAFENGDTPESVFERADAALYAAKNGGRNQCRAQS